MVIWFGFGIVYGDLVWIWDCFLTWFGFGTVLWLGLDLGLFMVIWLLVRFC